MPTVLDDEMREQLRAPLGEAIAFIRSKEAAAGSAGVTLQSALAEAIYEIDNSQIDPVANLSSSGTTAVQYAEGLSRVRPGKLQTLQRLKAVLVGSDGAPGVFDALLQIANSAETAQ